MANEITTAFTLNYSKNGIEESRTLSDEITVSGDDYIAGTESVGTTEEALEMGDVGTAGWAYFKNIDATNYVELGIVGSGTFYPFAKLKAGESCVLRLGTSTPYAKANTAACRLEYKIYED